MVSARFDRIVFIAAALAGVHCSSNPAGGGGSDAGSDSGTASGGPCATLCATGCAPSCTASCEAALGAVPGCRTQFEAVLRCAAANGARCEPQGSVVQASCQAQSQVYTACVAGGGTDGGTTPTDGGTSPTDGGTTPTDGATSPTDGGTSPSLAGRWTMTQGMFARELNFMGGPSMGALTYRDVLTLSGSGCVTTNVYRGTWALAGATLTVTFPMGTTEVTDCDDEAMNREEQALSADNTSGVARDYTGPITVAGDTLTFTMFRGTSTRAFMRAR